jgi:hypothetical protein
MKKNHIHKYLSCGIWSHKLIRIKSSMYVEERGGGGWAGIEEYFSELCSDSEK